MKSMKYSLVGLGTVAMSGVSAFAQEAGANPMAAVATEAQTYISTGVTTFASICVAGLALYLARWFYRKVIKGGISAA